MKITPISGIVLCLALAGFAASQVRVELAGKTLTLDSVQVSGKTYVSLDQLKAQLATQGGAQQLNASEGPRGEWLFNGVWRLKVGEVNWDAPEEQWVVNLSVKNGTGKTRMMAGSGFNQDGVTGVFLATESGTSLTPGVNASNLFQSEIGMKELPPGGQANCALRFLGKENDKPVKLILEMQPVAGLPFSKQPSFRVDLTRSK